MKPLIHLSRSNSLLRSAALALLVGMTASPSFAASPRAFVEMASEKSLAEIENGKLALQKSQSADVRKFAQMMIDDHQAANNELTELSSQLRLPASDTTAMMDRVKKLILEYREGSFDKAYANNQVEAHEQTIELFQEQVEDADVPPLQDYARKHLPRLEAHLEEAKKLQAAHP
jgi:putative membrane protein